MAYPSHNLKAVGSNPTPATNFLVHEFRFHFAGYADKPPCPSFLPQAMRKLIFRIELLLESSDYPLATLVEIIEAYIIRFAVVREQFSWLVSK